MTTRKRELSQARRREFAEKHNIPFIETSAKTAINVEEAFMTLTKDIAANLPANASANDGNGSAHAQNLSAGKQFKRPELCVLSESKQGYVLRENTF